MSKALPSQARQGWAVPPACREAHYFIAGKSLCGATDYSGAVEDAKHEHSDNCFTCMRLRLQRAGESESGAQA